MGIEEQIRSLTEKQQALVDGAKTENRDLTSEELEQFNRYQGSIDTLSALLADGQTTDPEREKDKGAGERGLGAEASDPLIVERQRSLEITNLCKAYEVDPAEYIKSGSSVLEVKAAILDGLKAKQSPVKGGARVGSVEDVGSQRFRDAVTDAFLERGGVWVSNPSKDAKDFKNINFRGLMACCLRNAGVTEDLNFTSPDDLFNMVQQRQYFNPTSSFPAILDNVVGKAFAQGYKNAPVTFESWVTKGLLSDFKKSDNLYLRGPGPEFLLVPEGGEIKHSTVEHAHLPQRQLHTYGRQFTLTREAVINDDIGLIASLPAQYAMAAKTTQNKQCYEILMNNPVIYDGLPLFCTEHHNSLATGTGFVKEAIMAMIKAMGDQKTPFGEAFINQPGILLVPQGCEMDCRVLFETETINTPDNTQAKSPLYGYTQENGVRIVNDPWISQMSGSFGNVMPWFMISKKELCSFMEIDYLNGNETPIVRRSEVPGQLGYVWDFYLDWGITVLDYRGIVKNPGVQVNLDLPLL